MKNKATKHLIRRYLFFTINILFLFCSNYLNAQNEEENSSFQQSVKQIEGTYYPLKNTFYCQSIDKKNIKITHQYVVDKFSEGYGIAEYCFLNADHNVKSKKIYGLIDTTGRILIPCIYDDLRTTGNDSFFIYSKKDSIGIVTIHNSEILKLNRYNTLQKDKYSKTNGIYSDTLRHYCILRISGSFGVFSYEKAKLVVHAEFDKISIYGNTAVCQTINRFVAYNCKTEYHSEPYSAIYSLNKNTCFFVRKTNGKTLVCNDPVNPEKTICKQMNREEAFEFYDNHIISKDNGKFGVIDEYGNEKIPFIYDDIYFFDEKLLLVKKENLWAIADYENNLKSDFRFIDVDNQNQINYENFVRFSGIDTADNVIMNFFGFKSAYGTSQYALTTSIQRELIKIKSELKAHKISNYKSSYFKQYVLQSQQGFQLITVLSSAKQVQIDSLYWDAVFMIPEIYDYPFEIGVQKGTRYGYYAEGMKQKSILKYDGIYFHSDFFDYESIMFSGTHNSTSPFAIVKRGYVYYNESLSKTNWLERIISPPNYACKYQGKPKWKRSMKETEFIKKRLGK